MKTIATLLAVSLGAVPLAAAAATTTLVATLNGNAGGEAKGSGSFTVEIDPEAGDFCYTLTAKGIGTPTMAHVHAGAAGVNGDPVVTIAVAEDECVAVEPAVLRPIVADPASFYVNVHTAAFPGGAIRGQLQKK